MGVLGALLTLPATAGQFNYQVEFTGLHSDNINLSEDNQQQETVAIPRLKFDFNDAGSTVDIQARGEVERRFYTKNSFEDETRSAFAGRVNWSVLPQRLKFVAEDYLSEQPIDIRDGRYPGNLQQVNVFLAGPSLFAKLGGSTHFQLDLRGADTYAEETEGFNSRRYGAAAIVSHAFDAESELSLHVMSSDVKFDLSDPAVADDYVRQDAFVRYQGQVRDVDYELDLGHSRLGLDTTPDESTSIGRATVHWRISPDSRVRIRARQHFSDEVQDLMLRFSDPDEALVPVLADPGASQISGRVYRLKELELDYRYSGERVSFRLRPRERRREYIGNGESNRTDRGVSAAIGYRLRPRMTVSLEGLVQKRDFVNRGQEDTDRVYRLGLDYQMTRHWGWSADLIQNNRESNLLDPVYKERVAQFTVWWKR
ncbi:hypothetical protein GCM10028795_19740 [Lysobacter olei]